MHLELFAFLFTALAVANTMQLIAGIGHSTTEYFGGDRFLATSDFSCGVKSILFSFSQHMHGGLILYLTIERLTAVFCPFIVKIIFNRSKAALYVFIISVVFLVFNVFVVMHDTSVMGLHDGTQICKTDLSVRVLIRQLFIGPIPLLIITPCNIVLVTKVLVQYRSVRHFVLLTQQQQIKKKSIKASILTLTFTLSYILLALPFNVFYVCCMDTYFHFSFLLTILPMTNASISFYAFILASEKYRRKVIAALHTVNTRMNSCLTAIHAHNAVVPEQELSNFD